MRICISKFSRFLHLTIRCSIIDESAINLFWDRKILVHKLKSYHLSWQKSGQDICLGNLRGKIWSRDTWKLRFNRDFDEVFLMTIQRFKCIEDSHCSWKHVGSHKDESRKCKELTCYHFEQKSDLCILALAVQVKLIQCSMFIARILNQIEQNGTDH